jgi:lipid-binding SYLF domain-containing protein
MTTAVEPRPANFDSVTSSSLTEEIYAFVFAQKGLMDGVELQGNTITMLDK